MGIERQDIMFECLSRKNVKNYLIWMSEVQKLAVKTCNLRLTALKSFMEYCADEDIMLVSIYNDVCSVRGMKEHKKAILYMTNEAVQALLKTPRTDTKKGRRNRMMLIMLYNTAARAQELVDITLRDLHMVNVKSPVVTLAGKGNKSRNVPLMDKTVEHINQYLQEFHPHPGTTHDDPLFFSMRDKTTCFVYRFDQSNTRSFLPEIETMLRERSMSVDEINDYFFIWVRQHYHEKIHSATKQKPMLCFESDSYPLRRVDLATLVDAFLVEETRKVDKTGVFRLNGTDYQAQLELARTKILVRYDPFEPGSVQVHCDGRRYADAYPLEIPEHVNHAVAVEETDGPKTATGLNYLELLKQKHQQGLSYSKHGE